jgi:threonyl-tRNA synthetase
MILAPMVRILPVSNDQKEDAKSVADSLKKAGFRVEIDRSAERLGKQIRKAELAKIPVVIVVGKKEVAEQTLSVRTRKQGDIGTLTMPDLQSRLQLAVEEKVTI